MADSPVVEAAKKAHWWFLLFIGGSVTLLLSGMGVAVYFGSFASAATVARHEHDLVEIKAVLPIIRDEVSGMRGEVRSLFEATRVREYRDHGILIPDPATPRDGGTP